MATDRKANTNTCRNSFTAAELGISMRKKLALVSTVFTHVPGFWGIFCSDKVGNLRIKKRNVSTYVIM